jgi:putative DNA primase/helicase
MPSSSFQRNTPPLYGGELLADLPEGSTVYLVETPSEVKALWAGNAPAVCPPLSHDGAWSASYTDQLRPFNVVVVPSVGYPSSNPMLARARAKALQGQVKSVKLTPPPPPGPQGGGMDVGSFLLRSSVDDFIAWAAEIAPPQHRNGHAAGGAGADTQVVMPHPSDPMAVAEVVLARLWSGRPPRLIRWQGCFYRWSADSYWEELPDPAVRADLYRLLKHAVYFGGKDKDTGEEVYLPWKPTKARIANVVEALEAVTYLGDQAEAWCWINYDGQWSVEARRGAPLPIAVIPVRDGLLDIRTRDLHPPTPQFLALSALPFDLNELVPRAMGRGAPLRASTPRWTAFLHSLWPDDPESIELLQDWFGYVLGGSIDQHKILVLVGPPRSGKGTIARVLSALVGARHVAGPTMGELAQNFGLASLIGKKLAVVADARFTGRDLMVAVERLLTISGADYIDVPRKFKTDWHGQLGVRFTFLSNELPRLPDVSGAIATRFLVLQLAESWLGREDLGLQDRLTEELPGILLWALDGLDRLRARGHFKEPRSTRDAVRALMESTSAIKAFLAERCELGPVYEAPTKGVFEAWREWCEANGIDHPGTAQRLGHDLRAAIPRLRTRKRGVGRPWTRMFVGLRLLGATEVQQGFDEYGMEAPEGEGVEGDAS